MAVTIEYLQRYIKKKDYNPQAREGYVLKLVEEVGELARAMRKDQRMVGADVKGTIEEELWDVMYYTLAIANLYGVEMEKVIPLKEAVNNEKYGSGMRFGDEV